MKDDAGSPTGESVFLYQPRSFLVIGSLSEFHTVHGVNEEKYSSFELFRRDLKSPEVVTFDELFGGPSTSWKVSVNQSDAQRQVTGPVRGTKNHWKRGSPVASIAR